MEMTLVTSICLYESSVAIIYIVRYVLRKSDPELAIEGRGLKYRQIILLEKFGGQCHSFLFIVSQIPVGIETSTFYIQ
jgi:hypothetical protein